MTKYLFFWVTIICAFALPIQAQEEGVRQLVPEEFIKARAKKNLSSPAKLPQYRVSTPAGKTSTASEVQCQSADCRQLGLTLWRLRGTKATDQEVARIIVQEGNQIREFIPERIAANTPMNYGERIRLSFEAPYKGYLYVIDRELYADGSAGKPYLIFPTRRTREGDNQVAPGHLIEIPAQDDRPNFFTLKQSRPDNISELITVIVSRQPLAGITITDEAQELRIEQVKQWEQQWSGKTEQFEMVGGAGLTWTKVEQQVGADRTRDLGQNDPGPQTIYRVVVKPDMPLLVKIGLRYQKAAKVKK